MRREGLKFGHLLALLLLTMMSLPAQAQIFWPSYPQGDRVARFHWEGVVDGTSIIRLRRRQVYTENISGLPVQNQRYNFTDPLPSARVDVRLEVLEGRGRVRLIEEPHPGNDHTAAVRIEDHQGGRSRYVFELHWQDRNGRPDHWPGERPRNTESFVWRGRVDGEVIIRLRHDRVRVENISGYGVSDERYRFSSPLPDDEVQVNLVDAEGRDEVVIVEQPSRDNNYSVAVRIRDRRGGAAHYAFTLTWQRRPYRDRPRDDDGGYGRVELRWSGRVDGRDLLRIRGSQLWIDHETGAPIINQEYRFGRALPYDQRTVTVRKLRGRGTVRVIEQPSRYNNFTATILIEDRDGGADRYEIEVSW